MFCQLHRPQAPPSTSDLAITICRVVYVEQVSEGVDNENADHDVEVFFFPADHRMSAASLVTIGSQDLEGFRTFSCLAGTYTLSHTLIPQKVFVLMEKQCLEVILAAVNSFITGQSTHW